MMPSRLSIHLSAPVLLLVAAVLTGCGGSPATMTSPSPAPTPLTPGVVSATANPQVASYAITPPKSSAVSVEFGLDTTYGLATSEQHTGAAAGPVTILVAGMKASTTYHMRAKVANDDGTSQVDVDQTFTTGPTPAGLVGYFTAAVTNGVTPPSGIELVNALPATTFATDVSGNVIWTYAITNKQLLVLLYPIKLLANGHFACYVSPSSPNSLTKPVVPGTLDVFREIDLAGTTIRELSMDQLNASLATEGYNLPLEVFTHDFAVLPNGHYLLMATMLKSVSGLTGSSGPTEVLGDVVIDVDENFKPVWVWNEFDHLDVNRQPMGFPDWTHSNAIAYSPDDGNFLISIRHQNWIVKVDYRDGGGTGNILWKLGEGGDFVLKGGVDPTDWFYAQHDVNFVSANTTGLFTLAIMDNGDDRKFPDDVVCGGSGAPPCHYSTAQVMQVDEIGKTATFLSHILPNLYSSFAGSTRVLPNNNIEYNLAGVGNDSFTYEVTPTEPPLTIWQMHIVGTNTYRSVRMPSLYPGVRW